MQQELAAIEASAMIRQAVAAIQARMAAQQLGELFNDIERPAGPDQQED